MQENGMSFTRLIFCAEGTFSSFAQSFSLVREHTHTHTCSGRGDVRDSGCSSNTSVNRLASITKTRPFEVTLGKLTTCLMCCLSLRSCAFLTAELRSSRGWHKRAGRREGSQTERHRVENLFVCLRLSEWVGQRRENRNENRKGILWVAGSTIGGC